MLAEIDELRQNALDAINAASDLKALEELRVHFLGRKSRIRQLLAQVGTLAPAERPALGQAAGACRKVLEDSLQARQATLQEAVDHGTAFDLSLPGRRPRLGKSHPLSQIADELTEILQEMGFVVADGPEVEDEYHNFDALNTPADHPARDTHDTFYLEDGRLLRTHTSTVQIRYMENHSPPLRIIAPGRCYRRDTVDSTHHYAFHQIEGLYVDEKVSIADLKGTLETLARRIIGDDTRVRLRPHFFPFTEPSVEYDFSTSLDHTGWLEIGGAGMVDPAVFEAVGYDPERYTGFAFGFGIDRIAMIRYGIDDVRLFLENDLRFIHQF
jgi:phenylalanyl-tRNA synthetase alpha chain